MATLLLPLNSYSPTPIRNPNLSSIKIKVNQRHSPFQTRRLHRTPFVRALEEDSNPETVQGALSLFLSPSLSLLSLYAKLIYLSRNLILTVKIFLRWRSEQFRSQGCAVHVEILPE